MAGKKPLKSAYELAMDRLRARDRDEGVAERKPLTKDQKDRIADARRTAQAKLAEVETNRFERLIKQGIVAREEYDRSRANLDALQAVVNADQAAIENSEQAVRADRAAIENARLQLDYSTIKSPM